MAKDTTGRLHVTVKSGGKRKLSSKLWLERQLNDPYVAQAKREGWRSRAAFKLIEIDDKYHFLKSGQTVVDLGAAPGGWSQIAARRIGAANGKGKVVAVMTTAGKEWNDWAGGSEATRIAEALLRIDEDSLSRQ